MADHIRITKAPGTWVVRAGGAILAESKEALELAEGDYPAVIYIPRGDVAMTFLEPSDTRTTCPWKGEADHFSIVTKSGRIEDAAWSYQTPKDGVARIAGHLAFYPDKVTLERI
jgi:uncharacterized protein (DUF427 family)